MKARPPTATNEALFGTIQGCVLYLLQRAPASKRAAWSGSPADFWLPALWPHFAACTSTARLYPANEIAAATGILSLSYENSGLGSGGVTLRMPDGEVLTGEYTTVDTDSTSFGTIMSGGQVSSYQGFSSGGGSPGTASLIGDRGTLMQCEYIAGDFSGTGACRTSKGGLYRLHF